MNDAIIVHDEVSTGTPSYVMFASMAILAALMSLRQETPQSSSVFPLEQHSSSVWQRT